MQIPIPESEVEFAREVDRLGALGLSQDEIAGRFGLTKFQVRHRLHKAHLSWGVETRVRVDLTGSRLADALQSGELSVTAEPAPAADETAAPVAA